MGVNVHRGIDIGVSEKFLHVLRRRPIGQEIARESVPLWHNKDKSENPCVATGWRFVLILFPLKTALKWGLREG